MAGWLEVMRRFSQFILLFINAIVVLLGFSTMVIGIWAKVDYQRYLNEISNNSNVAQLSILLIIVGLFVMIVGVIGAVGALFASKVFGRIILGLYAVILTLLVFCEIVAGIAAAVEQGQLETLFRNGSMDSFLKYNGSSLWNDYERRLHCCGAESWKDYLDILNLTRVPQSCCDKSKTSVSECDLVRVDPDEQIADRYLYITGCADAIINGVKGNLGAIAGGAIVLGLIQIAGIVMACFVAISNVNTESNKYDTV